MLLRRFLTTTWLSSFMVGLSTVLLLDISPVYAGFAPGTAIIMNGGMSRAIERLKVGDRVVGFDGGSNRVVGINRRLISNELLYAPDDTSPFMTSDHPLLTITGWKSFSPKGSLKLVPELSVSRLQKGDILLKASMLKLTPILSHLYLRQIQVGFPPHSAYVYDLHLDGDHTYYANGYVAHNSEKSDNGDSGKDSEHSDHNNGEKSGDSSGSSDSGSSAGSGDSSGHDSGGQQGAGGHESSGSQSGNGGHESGGSQSGAGGHESSGSQSGNGGQESGGGQSEGQGSQGSGDNGGSGGAEGNNSGDHGDHADEQAHQAEFSAGGAEVDASGANSDGVVSDSSSSESEQNTPLSDSEGKQSGISVHVRRSSHLSDAGTSNSNGNGRTIDLIVQLPEGTRELSEEEERGLLQKRWQGAVQ